MNYSSLHSKKESSALDSPVTATIAQSILDGQEEAKMELEKYQRNYFIGSSNNETIDANKSILTSMDQVLPVKFRSKSKTNRSRVYAKRI